MLALEVQTMELVSVLVGGALAIAGGVAAEWFAARTRQREAERRQLDQYRQDAAAAAVDAFDVVQQARPDALTLWGSHDDTHQRVQALNDLHADTSRLLLRLRIGRPTPEADAVATAADMLRRRLRIAVSQSAHYAYSQTQHTSDRGMYDEAAEVNDEARQSVAAFEAALKDL